MPTDHIRYDVLVQQALREMVRGVLVDIAKAKALPSEHHFFITFDTTAEGVRMSQRLRAQYPQQMTVVLQHQFWDLKVGDDGFEVGLSFGGVPEKLGIPFSAVLKFDDPSVQFSLQFETLIEATDETEEESPEAQPEKPAAGLKSVPNVAATPSEPEKDKPDDKGGAEVVRLDRFRKK